MARKSTLIVYKSKTGFTERYANWLWVALGQTCDLIRYRRRRTAGPEAYDRIVFGSYLYAGSISGIKWLKSELPGLGKKSVTVFVTGAMPPDAPTIKETLEKNFTADEWEKIRVFYFQGGLDYKKMRPLDRLLMAGMRKMMRKAKGPDSPEYQTIAHSFDATDKEAINPLVAHLLTPEP